MRVGFVGVGVIRDVVPRWHSTDYERRFRESMEGAYPHLPISGRQAS